VTVNKLNFRLHYPSFRCRLARARAHSSRQQTGSCTRLLLRINIIITSRYVAYGEADNKRFIGALANICCSWLPKGKASYKLNMYLSAFKGTAITSSLTWVSAPA